MTVNYFGVKEVAAYVGLEPTTIKTHIERGSFPEPDVTIGRIRGWSPKTIEAWWASRPGQGKKAA